MVEFDPEEVRALVISGKPDMHLSSEVEQMGDRAFDCILGLLGQGGLTPPQQVRAVQTLGLLTRHFCFPRKREVLEWAWRLAGSPDQRVRDAMVSIIVARAQQLGEMPPAEEMADIESRSAQALQAALDLGVSDRFREHAEAFLQGAARSVE